MVNKKQLEDMVRVSIKEAAPGNLPDILDVQITGETPAERLESYLAQVKNPYCFRVGKTPVKISFCPDGNALEERIKRYFLSLKS